MFGASIPSPDAAPRVIIADDQPIARLGIANLITAHGWKVCATAADGEEAVAKATAHQPDIVILDYTLPRLNGLDAARQIKRRLPTTEILIFTNAQSPRILLQLFHSSVRGCLLKTEPAEELLPALESVRRHHTFRSRAITDLREKIAEAASDLLPLTPRESEALRLISQGKSSKQMALRMGVSLSTIDTHRESLHRKLKVHSAAELIHHARQFGLVDL
jgi:DNA-binding NarL/FixJ family response regulator